MKHPLVVLAAAVLSGILIGVRETPPEPVAACLFATALAVIKAYGKCRDLKKQTLLFCALFIILGFVLGFTRASYVSKKYSETGTAAFFRKYEATNPGEFDYALYLKSLSITDEESRKRLKEKEPDPEKPAEVLLKRLNRSAGAVLDRYLPEHDAGIMRAMLLGDRTQMDEDVKDLYQASGISHLLAVSGLHVSMIGASLWRFLRKKLKAGLLFSAGAASAVTFIYSVFTGASGSSLRAAIMLSLSLAAICCGRTYDLLSSLSLAAAALLLWRPYLILQSGFQLSFGAVIGIWAGSCLAGGGVFKGEKEEGAFSKLKKSFLSSFSVSLVTLPVIAAGYFYVPVYSVFLNLAVVPLMTFVMVSAILVLFTGTLLPAGNITGITAAIVSAPGHYILLLYEKLCRFSSGLPHSEILLGKGRPLQAVIYYVLLSGSFYYLRTVKLSGRKKTAGAAAGIVFMLLLPFTVRHYEPGTFYVCAVDVGQGDCFHIHFKEGNILIDGGCSGYDRIGPDTIEPYLLSKGINKLSLVIISHADSDHVNGIEYLISGESKVSVRKLMLPAMGRSDEKYLSLRENGVPVVYAERGKEVRAGNMSLRCLQSATESFAENDTNRQSSVFLLDFKGFRMLFTGDITKEDELLLCGLYGDKEEFTGIDILKAAHHGSRTATSESFIKTLRPEYAVLSYGSGNRFGHPHEETLNTLSGCGVKMLETAKMGAVTIKVDEAGYTVEGFIGKGGKEH